MTVHPYRSHDRLPTPTTSAFGMGFVPVCYECRLPAKWVTPQEWSRRSGQPLHRTDGFPLHLATFWWCRRCDLTGARLLMP